MISFVQLAKQANCDVVSVRRWAKSNLIEILYVSGGNNKPSVAMSESDSAVFLEYWKNRKIIPSDFVTIPEIAKVNKVDPKTVRLWAERNQVQLLKINKSNSPPVDAMPKVQAEEFAKYYHRPDTVVVLDLLEQYNTDWRVIKRWAKNNSKNFHQIRSELGGRGRYSLAKSDASELEKHLMKVKEDGFFYVIQPVPELNLNRLKLGFTRNTKRRLAQHSGVCPNAKLVKRWRSKKSDEAKIRNFATQQGCKQLFTNINDMRCATEVFDCENYQDVVDRVNLYFNQV